MAAVRTTYETTESIFIAYYQRPGDASGVRFWADLINANNGDVNAVINAFASSPESVALYGPPPPQNVASTAAIQAFINSMYQGMFGRAADAAGLAFYTAGYIAGTFSQGSIALNILNGATGADLVAINNKIAVSVTFTEIQDGRSMADPNFGEGTVFNATFSGTADATAARGFLAPVLSSPTTIPSNAAIESFIKTSIANPGDPILAPDFAITANAASVNEGATILFTVAAKSVAEAGNAFAFTLSGTGLTAADVVGGSLTGTVVLDATGKAVISVALVNDQLTEGLENMKVTLPGVPAAGQTSAVVNITDTSITPVATYALSADRTSVNEGDAVVFTLVTTNVADGTALDFTLGGTGITAGDIVGGALAGTVVVNNGQATIAVGLVADHTTEGDQTLIASITGTSATASVVVTDTSLTPIFTIAAAPSSVVEGGTVEFTVVASTGSDQAGQTYEYTLSGTGLTGADVVGGSLTGTVVLDSTGKGSITIVTAVDYTSEGPETMKVTLVGVPAGNQSSASVTINDNTSGKAFVLTTGIDVPPAFEGTPYDDTFSGNQDTLNPGDNLQGGAGDDTFNYSTNKSKGGIFEAGFTTGSIETFNVTTDGSVTIDMSGTSDVELLVNQNSRADFTATNGPEIVELGFSNTTVANNFTVAYQASTVAGGNDTQEVYVDGVLNPSTLTVNGIENMVIVTGDADSSFYYIASDTLKSFKVEGTESLSIDMLSFPGAGSLHSSNDGHFTVGSLGFGGAGTVTLANGGDSVLGGVSFGSGNSTIDASGLGGMMDVTLLNATASGRNVAVTGSAQADLFDVTAGFNALDKFNGGGDVDEIYLDPSNFSVNTNAITNTEIADLIVGTLGIFDLAKFDTALNTIEVNTATASTVEFRSLESDGSELITVDNDEADLDGKTVSFDMDGQFAGGATVNFEVYNIDYDTLVHFQDTDYPTGVFNDPVGTLNLALWGWGEFTAHLDPMGNLTTLGLTGDADIVVTSDAPTVTVVNGGTTTGDVTISAGVLSNSGSTVTLGSGYDEVTGGNGDDDIDIGTGGGHVWGGKGNDTITGSGDDTVDFVGEDGNDVLTGGDGNDDLTGGNGADTLTGNGGDDDLQGDGGIDTLYGGTGEDFLWGGIGADQMWAGDEDGEEDTFYYDLVQESQGAGFADTIHEFVSGEDFVDLLQAMINAGTSVLDYNDMRFNGNASGFAAAQGSLTGTGGVEIVYDTLNTQVYVDVDGNGIIDGTNDMIIDFGSPATMQAIDFGIDAQNTFTAVSAGFDTRDPSTSFENTTTGGGNDYVVAEGNELVGSYARGNGGTDTFTVTTPINGPFDFQDLMNGPPGDAGGDFSRLNLHGGDTGLITGPDQWVDLIVNIGNAGGFFRTGTNQAWYVEQVVNSGSGDDDIRLTNDDDVANTNDGRDFVWAEIDYFGGVDIDLNRYGSIDTGDGDDWIRVQDGFDGTVEAGDGDDELEILAGTTLGADAILHGGDPTASDFITVDGDVWLQDALDLSGWEYISYEGTSNVHLTIDQYNGLGSDKVEDNGGLFDTENMTFYGAGTADLDSNLDDVGMGDGSTQEFILGDDDTDIVGGGTGNTTVVSNFFDLDGSYDGGGGTNTFVQNVDADFDNGTDPAFTNFWTLVLNNGADINDMSNSQHNSFGNAASASGYIIGNNGIGPNYNSININTTFTGTTQNTIETYTLDNNGGTNVYQVGGSSQTVTDSDTSGSTVTILGGLSSTTLNTSSGNDTVTINGGSSNITVDTNVGDDTVNATAGGTNITIITDGKDTVNLGGTHTGLSVSTDIDDDIVNAAAGSSLAGTINVGTGNDTLNLASGNYSNVTFSALDPLDTLNLTGTSYTFSDAQFDTLINGGLAGPTVTGLGGLLADETITISNAASVVFSNDILAANGQFKTLVTGAGDDVITFKSEAATVVRYLDVSAGGDDSLTINNIGFQAADNDSELVVTGFDVANDLIRLQSNGAANGNFQEIVAGDTNLTIGPNGVIEVNTAVGSLIGAGGAQSVGDGGAVESLIAGAVQSTNILGIAPQPFFAVLYASDGAAYIYAVNVTTIDANLNSGDFEVELLGQLNDVAANALTLGNFFA